jgi:hypothetical protein
MDSWTAGTPLRLDEVARLGDMSILQTVRREYGVNLRLLYQSLGHERWRFSQAGERTWFDSAFPKCFASIRELETAEAQGAGCDSGSRVCVGDAWNGSASLVCRDDAPS